MYTYVYTETAQNAKEIDRFDRLPAQTGRQTISTSFVWFVFFFVFFSLLNGEAHKTLVSFPFPFFYSRAPIPSQKSLTQSRHALPLLIATTAAAVVVDTTTPKPPLAHTTHHSYICRRCAFPYLFYASSGASPSTSSFSSSIRLIMACRWIYVNQI